MLSNGKAGSERYLVGMMSSRDRTMAAICVLTSVEMSSLSVRATRMYSSVPPGKHSRLPVMGTCSRQDDSRRMAARFTPDITK